MSADTAKCKKCFSRRSEIFNGEIAIHFPGLKGVDKPIVWVFPKMRVCLECGLADFVIPERELNVLRHGAPVEGAIISTTQKRFREDASRDATFEA
jgi:hypothetical protein